CQKTFQKHVQVELVGLYHPLAHLMSTRGRAVVSTLRGAALRPLRDYAQDVVGAPRIVIAFNVRLREHALDAQPGAALDWLDCPQLNTMTEGGSPIPVAVRGR